MFLFKIIHFLSQFETNYICYILLHQPYHIVMLSYKIMHNIMETTWCKHIHETIVKVLCYFNNAWKHSQEKLSRGHIFNYDFLIYILSYLFRLLQNNNDHCCTKPVFAFQSPFSHPKPFFSLSTWEGL